MKLTFCCLALSALPLIAANPYLDLPNDELSVRRYVGTEWGDDMKIPDGKDALPFSAKVMTQRIATLPWGAVYKVTVGHQSTRQIGPYHFVATDDEIAFITDQDVAGKIRKLQGLKTKPNFAKGDLCALTKDTMKKVDPPWTTEITVKGNFCTYRSWHDGSGHFEGFIWKKGTGLVGFGAGRGARQDGFELELKTP